MVQLTRFRHGTNKPSIVLVPRGLFPTFVFKKSVFAHNVDSFHLYLESICSFEGVPGDAVSVMAVKLLPCGCNFAVI